MSDDRIGPLLGVILRSALGIVLFFFLHGVGLLVAGYGLFAAIQCKSQGNRYGTLAIIIGAAGVIVVGIGWIMRLQGAPV